MSNTIQTSVNWATGYLGYSTPTVGPNNEPAITAANMTQQVMLSPPFKWAWNRLSVQFTATSGIQDYIVPVTDFGFAEIATFQPTGGKWSALTVLNHTPIGASSDLQQPNMITILLNVVATSIKVRFLGVPNNTYLVDLTYQRFQPLMATLSSNWTPPDYMSYIYNRGFLAHCMEAKGDPRAQQEKVNFAAALLGTAEGLTDTEKNIFLAQYLPNLRDAQVSQLKAQQGVVARGQ